MALEIRALTPELAGDYFDFFEKRAFTDDSPYRCYCQQYQMTPAQEDAAYAGVSGEDMGPAARREAERQIKSGALRGYLAYEDGKAIGWCNANDRAAYPACSRTGARFYAPREQKEKAVVCFEIAPECRGRGVATALLRCAVEDARREGYRAIVSFPDERTERFEWDCMGPMRLYEKVGFIKAEQGEGYAVMKLDL